MDNSSSEMTLPDFGKPPVVETVLGVQFKELHGLTGAHLGAFWKSLGDEWPLVEDAAPLPDQFEVFGLEEQLKHAAPIFLTNGPQSPRLRIRSTGRDRMIQVQRTRFHYNWIGHLENQDTPYARYPACRAAFLEHWSAFRKFLEAEKLGRIEMNQWEVTYVNHVPKGGLWHGVEDWSRVVTGLSDGFSWLTAVNPEDFRGEWHFRIPDDRGRLHVHVQRKLKKDDPDQEILEIMLTARGPFEAETTDESLAAHLDLGRHVIVQTFAELTSEKAHQAWERKT